VLAAFDGEATSRATVGRRLGAELLGGAAGALPLLWLWFRPMAQHGVATFSLEVVPRTWRLLVDSCLPWALSIRPYTSAGAGYFPWEAPPAFRIVQWAGASILVGGTLAGLALSFAKRVPWEVRRIGLVGGLALPLTLGAFLCSPMAMDHFSTRYLAAIL